MSLVVFYYSPLFQLALRTHTGHLLMTAHFLLTGYLFAWVLVGVDPGPQKWAPALRLVVLFATISFHAFFGVAMISGTTLLAPDFFRAAAPAVGAATCSPTSATAAASPGPSGELPTCCSRCWSPWPGSAATARSPARRTARPTATATPSSRHTTRACAARRNARDRSPTQRCRETEP